jgi:hypothetical protein
MFSAVLKFREALREALDRRVPIGETSSHAFLGCHFIIKMINPEIKILNKNKIFSNKFNFSSPKAASEKERDFTSPK